jgi:hypothetical protein
MMFMLQMVIGLLEITGNPQNLGTMTSNQFCTGQGASKVELNVYRDFRYDGLTFRFTVTTSE